MHLFLSPYNQNTVISMEYTGPLDFEITGIDYIFVVYISRKVNK